MMSFRMKGEGKLISNLDDEMREILAEFMVEVIKFDELAKVGTRFLISFQQALESLRRPSRFESSELVRSIIKENETKRVNAYIEAGSINIYDSAECVIQLNTSLCDLQDCLTKAKGVSNNLKDLMDKAGNALFMNSKGGLDMDFQLLELEAIAPDELDAANCASFMAIIYSMVKQDCMMQENIVSSLNFKSSSSELESYCLMWTLRPFIDDDVVQQALKQVR